jgi:MFS superfamily sulfate permease-like transporter
VTALLGVLFLGILDGVVLAVVASLLLLLRRGSRPPVSFLGRIPDTTRFSDLAIHPDNERVPGLLVFRVEAPLLYFNTEYVMQKVLDRVGAEEPPVRFAIWDLSSTPNLDVPGARAIKQLGGQLRDRGVGLRLVEARAQLRDLLRAEGIEESSGRISRLDSLSGLVEAFEKGLPPKEY